MYAHLYSSSMSASCSVLDSRLNDPSEESSVATPASSDWLPPLEEESSEDDFSVLLGLLGLMQFLKRFSEL